jgi:hypothetical protein
MWFMSFKVVIAVSKGVVIIRAGQREWFIKHI